MAARSLRLPVTNRRERGAAPRVQFWRWHRRAVHPGFLLGCLLLASLIAMAIAGPAIYPVDPATQSLSDRLQPPVGFGGTSAHPLGTDALGRDLLARIIVGARLSLAVGVVVTMLAAGFGITIGMLAGYFGGPFDRVVSWLADVQLAVPFVIVAIVLTARLGNGVPTVVVALALTGWVSYARVIRLQGRALRAAAWIEAARSVGAGNGHLLVRHLLPNLLPTVLVLVTQQIAGVILYEAALSYLGLGVGGNAISWGGMVADGQEAIFKAWWVSVVPGLAVALTVLGLNLVGDDPV